MPSKKKIAFIIDGKSERAIFEKLDRTDHDFSPIKRDKNGKNVTADAIANECIEILRFSGNLYRTNIIIVDREDRVQDAMTFEIALKALISARFFGQFELVVSDRMFENWILADIEHVSSKHPDLLLASPNAVAHEGTHGTSKLEDLWILEEKKFSNDKAGNCKKLFKHVRPAVGSLYSSSFERFLDILRRHSIIIH